MPNTRSSLKQINDHFHKTSRLISQALPQLRPVIALVAGLIVRSLKKEGKLIICGNGGSAADAQHFAAELVGRYISERQPLPAIALNTNSSGVTSIGNDYGFQEIFSRQLKAFARPGDVLFCISTSGNSENVVKAAKLAKTLRVKVISLTGNSGGELKQLSDVNLIIPSKSTPHIQEVSVIVFHTICDLIDLAFFQ